MCLFDFRETINFFLNTGRIELFRNKHPAIQLLHEVADLIFRWEMDHGLGLTFDQSQSLTTTAGGDTRNRGRSHFSPFIPRLFESDSLLENGADWRMAGGGRMWGKLCASSARALRERLASLLASQRKQDVGRRAVDNLGPVTVRGSWQRRHSNRRN